MIVLERIRLVQFHMFEQIEVELAEITGIFGANGSGKSTLLDAVQIAMLGAKHRLLALNAQADDQHATRSIRDYCLGQYGDSAEQRVRDSALTYVTLIWRNTADGSPISNGLCVRASADQDRHEVLGLYLLPGIELALSDHTESVASQAQPRSWPTFRHELVQHAKSVGVKEPLFTDANRYLSALLLALRGSARPALTDTFARAFRFGLKMRFDKPIDEIVRNDVLEARPTQLEKFREVTESFRKLKLLVEQIELKITEGERVRALFDKAAEDDRRVVLWSALHANAELQRAVELREEAELALADASELQSTLQSQRRALDSSVNQARAAIQATQREREAHGAHGASALWQNHFDNAQGNLRAAQNELREHLRFIRATLRRGHDAADQIGLGTPVAETVFGEIDQMVERLATDSADEQALVSAMASLSSRVAQALVAVQAAQFAIKTALSESTEQEQLARSRLSRVGEGRAPLSDAVERLRRALADEGIEATPVCDLVRILDPTWQSAIEAYLRQNVEALLVGATDETHAFEIYRREGRRLNIHGAKIAMASRQQLDRVPDKHSVAALITGDNAAAVAYLRRQFGDIQCAERSDEALQARRSLTRDGMLVNPGDFERLRLVTNDRFMIGVDSRQHRDVVARQLREAEARVRDLTEREQRLGSLITGLASAADGEQVRHHVQQQAGRAREARVAMVQASEQLLAAAPEDYVALGAKLDELSRRARVDEQALHDVIEAVGKSASQLTQCQHERDLRHASVEKAQQELDGLKASPVLDRELEGRQWDSTTQRFGGDYAQMSAHAVEQREQARKSCDRNSTSGVHELAGFLIQFHESASREVTSDWRAARTWLQTYVQSLNDTELVPHKQDMAEAYLASQETFRTDVAITLNSHLDWLDRTMERLNAVLRDSPAFSNGEYYRFKRMARPHLDALRRYVKYVADHGPTADLLGDPGEIPAAFAELLDERSAPAHGVRSPLDDYREFFDFDIEVLRADPVSGQQRAVGMLSKRLGRASGGEHRAPLYVIAGAALASAYRLDERPRDGLRLMLIDEAFYRMDHTNIIATMRYLEQLGLQLLMASPGENLGVLNAFLHRYYDILRDADNNTVLLEGHSVSEETRQLCRSDLPQFNPELIDEELRRMRRAPQVDSSLSSVAG